ncbi:phosphatidylglycerophosphatase A [Brevibacillus fulvus]|uniref:Phosphatidylglycerophosphatase A n=1 Tax=Brevibacillus fulvus TaxID=1125967 RepID=A0A938Y4Y5_9BACL|nr:phosphatidylglycerophosphatase A [Brevibacillus fulvus]MBM7592026.1 phosphatidylglycerophosphatase A [Brevibacillus fulvus]
MVLPKIMSEAVYEKAIEMLKQRGVKLEEIAEIVYFLQKDYIPDLTTDKCIESIRSVLQKREVQNALLTGIQLDILAENSQLFTPLQEMVETDESLYGIDEVLSMSIVNLYGSIGYTNFGYVDKIKHGVLARLNDKRNGVNTFLDDLVGAIAAAASSRLAHRHRQEEEEKLKQRV